MALFRNSPRPPPPPREWIPWVYVVLAVRTCRPPRVKCEVTARGEVGDGMGSPLAGFPPNKEIQFFDDFSKVTWLLAFLLTDIFSSWNCRFLVVTWAFRWWLFSAVLQKTASAAQQLYSWPCYCSALFLAMKKTYETVPKILWNSNEIILWNSAKNTVKQQQDILWNRAENAVKQQWKNTMKQRQKYCETATRK